MILGTEDLPHVEFDLFAYILDADRAINALREVASGDHSIQERFEDAGHVQGPTAHGHTVYVNGEDRSVGVVVIDVGDIQNGVARINFGLFIIH